MAQDACGFGMPTTSIKHMRQLPAIERRSWKQKRGISAPAASQAWSSVYSGGTSISLPSTMSLVILSFLPRPPLQRAGQVPERHRRKEGQRRIDREQHRVEVGITNR